MNKRLTFGLIFWVSVLTLWGFMAYKVSTTPIIETDILALLPDNENLEIVRYAEQQTVQYFQHNIIILVGHPDVKKSVETAGLMREKLLKTNLFSKAETHINAKTIEEILVLYRKHSATFLTPHQRQLLESDDMSAIRKALLAKVYSGFAILGGGTLTKDPLMLSGEAITEVISKNAANYVLIDDVPTVSDGTMHYALLRIKLAENPFSLTYQKRVLKALDTAQSELSDVQFIRSGLIFHAMNGSDQAKTEMSTMGTISLVGVFLLLTLTFKSIRPFFFSAFAIIGGGAFGLAACLLLFDKVHLLTLVFGTSLVGVSIDYTLHFFAHKYERGEWHARNALNHIFSGISLGLVTSIIGFLSLLLTPFSVLQQMAIFSVAGLVFVYGIVIFVYPVLFKKFIQQPSQLPFHFSSIVLNRWQQSPHKNTAHIFLVATLAMAAVLPFLEGQDDVRAMQTSSSELVQQDMDVAKLLGAPIATQFFIVSGDNHDSLLENIQALTAILETSDAVDGYQSLVDYIAPESKQMNNVTLTLDFVMRHEHDLRALFQELSMPESTYNDYVSFLQIQKPLPLASFLKEVNGSSIAMLNGGTFEEKMIGYITLNGVRDYDKLTVLAQNSPNAIFVDKVASITETFDHHRIMAVRLIIVAYILIFTLLYARYGLCQSALILSPSVLASLTSIIVLSFIGGHYSLFHILALFLVMGISVDYGLFLVESKKKKGDNIATMTAITLSAITTLLSFGLLATSATSALHDFGMIIVLGIIITYILSPIVLIEDIKGANA